MNEKEQKEFTDEARKFLEWWESSNSDKGFMKTLGEVTGLFMRFIDNLDERLRNIEQELS